MEKLPQDVEDCFMKGEHVMRHQKGLWNAIWSDMFIETTFMRYGKGPGGLIGVTLKPKAVKKWANSLHICTQVLKDLDEMRDRNFTKEKTVHKEEMPSRIKADEVDRENIKRMLKSCFHPLDTSNHPETLFNIQSGNIAHEKVNAFDAFSIGKQQMNEKSWPKGFYSTIQKRVQTMIPNKNSVRVGDIEVYNTEIIYARVMCLLSTNRIKLDEVLKYELSSIRCLRKMAI